MLSILKYELRSNMKNLIIWALAIGGMGMCCILLYQGMEDQMADMADNFASMGAFSDAFGMSVLSIATLKGYFATEIGTIHALGSSMFAASLATVVLSKEEDKHTAEFTYTLPLSRGMIIVQKYLAVLVDLCALNLICGLMYEIGIVALGQDLGADFLKFMAFQLLMNVEIASICLVISAVSRINRLGVGISVAVVCYFFDIMARVLPDLKDALVLSPLSYANAAEIFSGAACNVTALVLGISVIVLGVAVSFTYYSRRDLAS